MKTRHTRQLIFTIILLALALLLPAGMPTHAAPPTQEDDPCAQCAEGVQLFLDGRYAEALPLLEAGFAGRENASCADLDDMGLCALDLGNIRDGIGDRTGALEAFTVALEIFRSSGNRAFEGITLNNIGAVYWAQGRYAEALENYQQALVIHREVRNRPMEGTTLNNIGEVHRAQGRYAEASEAYQRALTILREVGNRAKEGATLNNIGAVYQVQGRYAEALEMHQQALAIAREVGDRAGEGSTLHNIGLVYQMLGRRQEALRYLREALAIFEELGDQQAVRQIGDIIEQVSKAPPMQEDDPCAQCAEGYRLFREGRYAEALPLLEAGFAGRENATCANPDDVGFCALVLGRIRDGIDKTSALEAYTVALEIFHSSSNRVFEAITLNNIGEVYRVQGRYTEALEYFQQALIILREVGDRGVEGATLNNIGGVYYDQGRYREALDAYQQALVIQRELGDRVEEEITLNNIREVYSAQEYEQVIIEQGKQEANEDCDALNQAGEAFYRQAQYPEALQKYRAALVCYQEIGDRAEEGTTLALIGGVYANQGRYTEALEMCQQALAIAREVDDRALEGAALNNIGFIYGSLGQYPEALNYSQQALTIRQELGDRAGEGVTLNNIGFIYYSLGQYQEALDYYQQAQIIRQKIDDGVGEGVTLNNIGGIYKNQGQYQEALEYFQQALAVAQEIGDRAGEGGSLNNIGLIYERLGQYQEALAYYQQALTTLQKIGYRRGEAVPLNNIGAIYNRLGQYQEALDHYQRSLAISQELGDRAGEGMALNNIGIVYDDLGQYQEALKYYQEALAIKREIGDHAGEGTVLNNIGAVYHNLGQYQEALDHFQKALAIRQEIGDHAGEGTVLNNIGTVYRNLGQYQEALDHFQKALVIKREAGDRTGEGTTLTNIGDVYAAQGRYPEALEMCQQALDILREVGDRAREEATLNNIGAVYAAQGRYAEALTHYQQAMDILEEIRAVAGSEPGRASFITQHAHLYAWAAGLFHQQGQDEKAFLTSERGRARAFLDSLATGQVELTDNEAAALLAHEQEAYAGRLAAQDALARARGQDSPDAALVTDLEEQLAAAEEEYAAALAAIEARGDQLAALVPGRSVVLGLSDVQALLGEQTTLVSYFILEDETLAFLITHDSFHIVALDVSREEISAKIGWFRQFPDLNETHPESAVTLYGWLIEPLKEYLPSTSSGQVPSTGSGQETTPHLAIVPHSVLHYLPFAALTDGQRYLVDDYVITYLPSASALKFIQANVGGAGTPLILGNPATDDPKLRPLRYAGREAQAIAALYDVQPLLGEAATESAVRERASQAGILHLAAHGGYNRYNPLYSAIALAPDEENDGRLEVHEVYGLDLTNAGLVVLGACETQLGELSVGDEVVGLTRAFFFAGTPSVVATLWSVDDRPTGMLMERFYTHLREGIGKAEALRQAQLDVRAEYPNPYYWSGFVLSGDGGAVAETSRPSSWIWLIVGNGLLIVVVVGGVMWRRATRHPL